MSRGAKESKQHNFGPVETHFPSCATAGSDSGACGGHHQAVVAELQTFVSTAINNNDKNT